MNKILPRAIWLIVTLFVMYELFINNGFYGIAIDAIKARLSLDNNHIGLLAFVAFAVYALFQLPAGILIGRYSSKIIVSSALFTVSAGMFIFAIATSFEQLLIAKIIIAVGSAFAFVSAAALIGRWFAHDKFSILFGLTQALGNISVVCAGIFLPELLSVFDLTFIGIAISIVGCLLVAPVVIIVKDNISNSLPTQESLCVLCALKTLATNKDFVVTVLFASFLVGTLFNFGGNWQVAFQLDFKGNNLSTAADIDSIMFLGFAFGAPILGALSAKLRQRKSIMSICSFLALCLMGVLLFAPQVTVFSAKILYFLFGFCCGGGILAYTVIMEILPQDLQSVGVGLCNGSVYLIGALISLIIGFILNVGDALVYNGLVVDRISLSLFFFALLQAFTLSFFIKESYKEV